MKMLIVILAIATSLLCAPMAGAMLLPQPFGLNLMGHN